MAINAKEISDILKDGNKVDVEKFTSYLRKIECEKDRQGNLKNPWIAKKSSKVLADYFLRVSASGIKFDGEHVTLQSRGISLDYVAYKNKMLNVYPETKIAVGVVHEGDAFDFSESDGKVSYNYTPKNPFNKSDDKIIGAYCVIKNNRGEYITTLDKLEIQKHRRVAKTDYIWKNWYPEMVQKTVIKKACKFHFDDLYSKVDEIDNETINLELPTTGDLSVKQRVEKCETEVEVNELFREVNPDGDNIKFFHNKVEELRMGANANC